MRWTTLTLLAGLLAAVPTPEVQAACSPTSTVANTYYDYINLPGVGNIAVKIETPVNPRYGSSAPIVVNVPTFFTPSAYSGGFGGSLDVTDAGAVWITFLIPGKSTTVAPIMASGGTPDYGGKDTLDALRQVLRFASGMEVTTSGNDIFDVLAQESFEPDVDNVGMYAFSHPGILATNLLAKYNDSGVDYLVGAENPTIDMTSSVEVGHYGPGGGAVLNPTYNSASDYFSNDLTPSYANVGWNSVLGVPEIHNGAGAVVHTLGTQVPTMFGKSVYSIKLTQAMTVTPAVFAAVPWGSVATLGEATAWWSKRVTVGYGVDRYADAALRYPDGFPVMLVFADQDHVQPASDKPHIHQAYDGFRSTAGFWVRLNPDQSYQSWAATNYGGGMPSWPDNGANTEPGAWDPAITTNWSISAGAACSHQVLRLAGVAEMADRVYTGDWTGNLASVLVGSAPPP